MEQTPEYNRTGRQHAAYAGLRRLRHDDRVRQHDGRHRLRHRQRAVAVGRHHHRPRHAAGRPGPPAARHDDPHGRRHRRGLPVRPGRAGVRPRGGHADRERARPARRALRPRAAADRHRVLRREHARQRPGRAVRRRADGVRPPRRHPDEQARSAEWERAYQRYF